MNITPSKTKLVRITLCAPGDVQKEIAIVEHEIAEWNRLHWDATSCGIKSRHWKTDAVPDMSDRPQGVINAQLIDDADAIVAVFWSRFGTPTGVTNSGTEEEVRRSIQSNRRVFLYFSDLEPLPHDASDAQVKCVERFREEMKPKGLAFSFRNRAELKNLFGTHLAKFMDEMLVSGTRVKTKRKQLGTKVSQSGSGNTQVVGDQNIVYQKPPVIRTILPTADGSVTPAEQRQIKECITSLVEKTTGGASPAEAFAMWWSRLTKKFKVARYQQILSKDMPEIQRWHKEQLIILKAEGRKTAPELWKNDRITAIKSAIRQMGRSNEDYYPELSDRLNMKRAFKSLPKLTKTDLERVYRMVMSDARKKK